MRKTTRINDAVSRCTFRVRSSQESERNEARLVELYGRGGSFNQGVKRRREAFSADRVIAAQENKPKG
ncbi:hypothetical protein M2150_001053 [Lachnospiraceae bacterium PM6-15]|uniref:hypothetical protein n=1 Tax=Ohessyouella blattaphilus TaxID=2949333 RepID=UPI003E2456D0